MKTSEPSIQKFENLSPAELYGIGGEGFAYDVGRTLRFIGLSACGINGTCQALLECIILSQ